MTVKSLIAYKNSKNLDFKLRFSKICQFSNLRGAGILGSKESQGLGWKTLTVILL